MNTLRKSLFAFAAFVCLPSAGNAAVIYSQAMPEEPGAAFSSLNLSGAQKIADNFILDDEGNNTIRSIRFIGAPTNTDNPFVINNFRITFFEDDDGVPGMLLAGGDFDVGDAIRKSPTGGRLFNGIPDGLSVPVEYKIDLGPGVTLNPNTTYWMSITNDLGANRGWLWARANGVLDQTTAGTNGEFSVGEWNAFQNGGMLFELNDQNIPEPSTLLLALSATIVAALSR